MKKWLVIMAIILFASIPSYAVNSWVRITQPEPGVYMHGKKILPSNAYIFIGYDFVEVVANASPDIFVMNIAVYDVMKKEKVAGVWDYDSSDGYSYNFTGIPSGIYAIAAIGAAIDIEEPIAFDWIMPVIILHG